MESEATAARRAPRGPSLRELTAAAAERRMEELLESGVSTAVGEAESMARASIAPPRSTEAEAVGERRRLLGDLAAAAAARRMESGAPAEVEEVESSTRSPPPPWHSMEIDAPVAARPPTLRQRLAAALRGRLARGVDAVLCAFVAAVWAALLAGNIPMVVGRWAGGGGSTVEAIGRAVSWVAVRAMVLLAPAFVPLFLFRGLDREPGQAVVRDELESSNVIEGGHAIDGVHPERNGIWRKLAKYVNSITKTSFVVFCLVIFTGMFVKQLAPGRGSGLRIIGSILVDIGFLVCSALSSLIIVPNLVLELRREGVL